MECFVFDGTAVYGIQLLPITGVSERLLEPEWVSTV
jgi:hypothetical protein